MVMMMMMMVSANFLLFSVVGKEREREVMPSFDSSPSGDWYPSTKSDQIDITFHLMVLNDQADQADQGHP